MGQEELLALDEVHQIIQYLMEQFIELGYDKERIIYDIQKSTGISKEKITAIFNKAGKTNVN